MKLAEALLERKAKQLKIADLENRLLGVCTFQEGSEPAEDANKLLGQITTAYEELAAVVQRINRTNSFTVTGAEGAVVAGPSATGETLSDLIVQRDLAVKQQAGLKRLANTVRANLSGIRLTRSEVKIVTRIDIAALEHQVDDLGQRALMLDSRIQALNWSLDLR